MMKLIETTATHEIFLSNFQGMPVRWLKDRVTGELNINGEDMAKVLGYDNLADILSQDKALDIINDVHKRTGKFPLTKVDHGELDQDIKHFAVRCSGGNYTCVYARLNPTAPGEPTEHVMSGEKTYYPARLLPDGVFIADELQALAQLAIVVKDKCVLNGFALEDNTGKIYQLDWDFTQDMGAFGMIILFKPGQTH